MKKTIVLLVVLNIIAFFAMGNVIKAESVETDSGTEQFIRLHVRANSDSDGDQTLKLQVRDRVLAYTSQILSGTETKEQAMQIVGSQLDEIAAAGKEAVTENGFDYNVSAELKKEHFEYREYEGFYLPEDIYDSLIISIGEAQGHNWWCVIFPAVCLSGSVSEKKPQATEPDKFVDKESIEELAPYNNVTGKQVEKKNFSAEESRIAINIEAVPEQYRLAEKPAPQNVEYKLWIVEFFKNIFQ